MMGLILSLVVEGEVFLAPIAQAANLPAVASLTVSETPGNDQSTMILAHGSDPGGLVEYQFWVENHHGWSMMQNYSPKNDLILSASSGSEVVTVYALDQKALEMGKWHSALAQTVIINHDSAVSLSSPPTATAGNAVLFHAQAQHLVQPVYQYWIENPQREWSASGNYRSSSGWTYTPSRPGTYHIVVYAKDLMAPNNATNAVWTHQTLTVAPFMPQGYQLQVKLANPNLELGNPNALLLGHVAQVEAVVRNANEQPVADVPVLFTATNDSNPNDHVSFAQGLNDETYTNQNGVAIADLYVTNPTDPSSSQLAQDASALTLVGYTVSLPQDALVDPVSRTIAYAAYIPPNLDMTSANLSHICEESLYRNTGVQQTAYLPWETAGYESTIKVQGHYLLPVASQHGILTIPVNYDSGAYGPDVMETSSAQGLPTITIDFGFDAASIDLTKLGLSSGSSFTVNFTEGGNTSPTWSKTITGPVSFNNQVLQIPASPVGGQITFQLQSGPVVNPAKATGVDIGSVVVDAGQNPGTEVLPASLPVTWSSVPITYGPWQSLSSQEAALYVGDNAVSDSSNVVYQYKVPAFPEVGNAVLEELVNNQPQAYYWIPTTNNGANQNVLINPSNQGPVAIPITPASLTSLLFSTGSHENRWTLSSQHAGQTELVAQVSPGHFPRPSDTLYSYMGWIANTPATDFVSQYAVAGQQVQIKALVTDEAGNQVPDAPVNWLVQGGVNVIQQDAMTNSQGIATLTLSAANAAAAMVEASSPGEQVSLRDVAGLGSFTAAKIHFVSWHWHDMTMPALSFHAGSTHIIGVMAQGLTASGHAVPLTNIALTLSQKGVGEAVTVSNGQTQVGVIRVNSDQAGNQNIWVSPNADEPNLEIAGQPDAGQGPISGIAPAEMSINYLANGGTLKLCVPSSLAAIGTVVPIDVKVADSFGNPVVGQSVNFTLWPSSGGTATLSSSQSVTNAQGMAQVFLSGGSVGEVDEVAASLPGHEPHTTLIQWQNAQGVQMALVNAQIGGSTVPNTVILTMSRRVNPKTLLSNGSQFQLEDVSTNQMYQIAHATASGNTITLTLASSNPVFNFNNQIYQVSIEPVTDDGVTSAVMDFQDQAAKNTVTLMTPSSPAITASLASGTLTIVLANGSEPIPQGLSVSVVPSNVQASINNGQPGAIYQISTTASTNNTATISVPISGPAGTVYTIYFDGISGTCS
ncbi:Ig-like domain-containing protein [Sulfobacillus thermosulfidooxidans]|uniref:Ig-like domain-containing protein n=1 Tax=Sulfobacillus thermosulfidooxidans TaxID=28034 RepID=UPI0006B5637A|nr:Ig-like domain-containing protein [Sulfobacillus thermosulfidooxidans]